MILLLESGQLIVVVVLFSDDSEISVDTSLLTVPDALTVVPEPKNSNPPSTPKVKEPPIVELLLFVDDSPTDIETVSDPPFGTPPDATATQEPLKAFLSKTFL